MTGLHLLATIAGERIAFAAADIESVIEIAHVTPVPGAPDHIVGLTALRSRVLTLVDCRLALGLPASAADAAQPARGVVTVIDGHGYALLVDSVDDVTEVASMADTLTAGLGQGWAQGARGMVAAGDALLPVLDPARLILVGVPDGRVGP